MEAYIDVLITKSLKYIHVIITKKAVVYQLMAINLYKTSMKVKEKQFA